VDEQAKELLRQFDGPFPVASATLNAFKQVKYFPSPGWICDAAKNGLIEPADEKGPIVNSDAIYKRDLKLTAAGRELFGLPPLWIEKPKSKSLLDFE
jgi:hypothetical protein